MTYVRKLFLRLASSFDYFCGTYKSIFFGLERLLKTQFSKKKATLPVKKKYLTSCNSYYRLWQTSRYNLKGSASTSYQYCMNYSRIFLGSKRLLKTQTFEKRQAFHWKKYWCPSFFSFYRASQSSRDNIQGSKSDFYQCCKIYKGIF